MVEGGMPGCWGHAWLWGVCVVAGGMCDCQRGACVVAGEACMVAGGGAWLLGGMHGCGGGMCGCGGACIGYDEIRSMSGRYASYWNAFLFSTVICFYK